jgi:dTDP-glucose 4,6-dehydratase
MVMVIPQRFGAGHRVLISGGAGFVPSHVVDALLARGCSVVAIDNFITGAEENVAHLRDHPEFTLVKHDLCDGLPEHHPALAGRFDAILHMASPASPTDFTTLPIEILRVGSLGTLHLLDRAVTDGCRFLLASTSEAYGDPLVHPQPESYWGNVNPVGVRSVYDEGKRFAEAATMAYRRSRGADTAIVRIFNTFGPRMKAADGRAIPTFINQALRGEPVTVHGSGRQTRAICYVEDLVHGILLLLDSGEPGPVNCGTEHELSMRELAERIVALTGSRSEIIFVDRGADDPEMRRPDLTLARARLGYEPTVEPDEGLRRTIAYFRARLA